MLKYFDLNQRAQRGLRSKAVELGPPAPEPAGRMSAKSQICLYFGIFIGVLLSSAIDQYKIQGTVNFNFSPGVCLISGVVALILVPLVYEKLRVDPASPFIVQLGLFVQQGVFWQVLMDALFKT